MSKPALKVAEIYQQPKDAVLKCLRSTLEAIESGKLDPRKLCMVIARADEHDDETITYNIRSSNMTRGEMLWMFEVGKRYCFDGDNVKDDDDASV